MTASGPAIGQSDTSHIASNAARPLKHRPCSARMQPFWTACRDVALWIAPFQLQQLACISHKPPSNFVSTSHFGVGSSLALGRLLPQIGCYIWHSKFASPSKPSRDEPDLKKHKISRGGIAPITRRVHRMASLSRPSILGSRHGWSPGRSTELPLITEPCA
jgi:hypothetical protein